jgi:RNA polymerase sigma-70 factor (ECF subfamily)
VTTEALTAQYWPHGAPPHVVASSAQARHPADLVLVLACLERHPGALSALSDRIEVAARRIDAGDDELAQLVRERLFTPPDAPRLASYDGSSPLAAWLRAIAVRVASNARRGRPPEVTVSQVTPLSAAEDDPELTLLKLQYQAKFRAAFQAAVAALSPTERTMLRLHAVDGVSLASIGTMFHRDASTVSRWLEQVRRKLELQTREHLLQSVAAHELDSVLRLARSQLSVGLSRILAPS